MIANDNLEVVVSFLPDVKTMAAFASTGRLGKDMVYASIPVAIQSAKPKMTKLQRDTLCNLKNPGLGHLKAIVERKCLVCKKDFKGAIRAPWGIPAHKDCNKRLGTNVKLIKWGIPESLMSLIRATIPVEVRDGFTVKRIAWNTYNRIRYTSERVIVYPIPGVIQESVTLQHFKSIGVNEVSAWMKARDTRMKKRKLEDEEYRITRRRICQEKEVERRLEIEGIVKTTYQEWVRTVPPKAKKFVAKLKGWESVDAVALINANADLPDAVHERIFGGVEYRFKSRWFMRSPSLEKLIEVYQLVRENDEALYDGKILNFDSFAGMHYGLVALNYFGLS